MEECWLSPPRLEKTSVFALALGACGIKSQQKQRQELIRLMRLGLVTSVSLSLQEASLPSKLRLCFHYTGDMSLLGLASAIEWWRSHKSKMDYLRLLEKRHGFSREKSKTEQAKRKLHEKMNASID
jgi:hypothetical protein